MNKNIEVFSIYSDYRGSLGTGRQSYHDVLVCTIDANYREFCSVKLVNGRFFSDADYETGFNCIIIEKAMAVAFFSTYDCIGREVELNGETFKVIGVYEKSSGLVDIMSAVSSSHVFIPYLFSGDTGSQDNMQSQYSGKTPRRQVIFFRVKDNLSAVLAATIRSNLEVIFNTRDITIENVDLKVRQAHQKIKAVYFIIVCMAIIYLVKWLIPMARKIYENLKSEMQDYYPPELLKRNWHKLFAFLLAACGLAALSYLALDYTRPALIIDPEYIPSRLANTRELASKISNYFIKANTEQRIVSSYHAFVSHVNGFITYLGFKIVLCCWRIMRGLYKSVCSLGKRYGAEDIQLNDTKLNDIKMKDEK
ncbi:MAG: ABC transporter permease [Clostridiaceae bacterium]|nr:ABC transporter permease [Clostridiaceae bacterium]